MTVVVSDKAAYSFYEAKSLALFIERVGYIKSSQRLYFRGLSNIAYDLTPSVARMIDKELNQNWLPLEKRLVEFAEQKLPEIFAKSLPTILVSNMQHYGIPTRMMDVTGNALVALFFACDKEDTDGKVVVFEGTPVSAYNPYANIIADTYRLTGNERMSLKIYQNLIYKQPYASSLIGPINDDIPEKNYLFPKIDKPMIIDVGTINIRQRNQDGKFIVFPNKLVSGSITNDLVTFVDYTDMLKAVIKIPKEAKKKIRDQLHYVGITDSFIYPDDISRVFNELKQDIKNELPI